MIFKLIVLLRYPITGIQAVFLGNMGLFVGTFLISRGMKHLPASDIRDRLLREYRQYLKDGVAFGRSGEQTK